MRIGKKQKENNKIFYILDVDGEEWNKILKQARNHLKNDLTVVGFRKGHTPEEVASKYIKESDIFSYAINIFSEKEYETLQKNNEINNEEIFFESCKINVMGIDYDRATLKFEFDMQPTITLADYKKIILPKQDVACSDEEIQKEKEILLKNEIMLMPKKSDVIENNDIVVFDFKGFIDDKPFEGGEAKFYELEIGSKQFIPGFEEQMLGLHKNQQTSINVVFPENYPHKEYASHKARFDIKIHDIKVKKISEINDDLVKSLKINGVNNVIQFENYIKQRVIDKKNNLFKQKCTEVIFQFIMDNSSLSYYPKKFLDDESNQVKDFIKQKSSEQGVSEKDFVCSLFPNSKSEGEALYQEIAKKNMILMFSLKEFIKLFNISVNEKDIGEYLENLATRNNVHVSEIKKRIDNNLEEIENYLVRDKIINELIKINLFNQ